MMLTLLSAASSAAASGHCPSRLGHLRMHTCVHLCLCSWWMQYNHRESISVYCVACLSNDRLIADEQNVAVQLL